MLKIGRYWPSKTVSSHLKAPSTRTRIKSNYRRFQKCLDSCGHYLSTPFLIPLRSFFQTKEQSLVLPDGVLKAIRSQSCDAVDVMAQMEESVKTLQLKSAALADPTAETKQWIRCLAINAKNENRMDIVTHLRSIVPAGTTGELTLMGVIG